MSKANIGKIRIKLQAYDHAVLEKCVGDIIHTVKRSGGRISGPIPLPTKRRIYTVLRSPHVDKKSREQFQLKIHKRIIDIKKATNLTTESLKDLNLPAGVDVEIKMMTEE